MVDFNVYSELINVSDDKQVNATNFLESLQYRQSGFKLLELVRQLEGEFKSESILFPSFKGETALSEGHAELEDEQEKYLECLTFQFPEYETESVFEYLQDSKSIIANCTKVVHDQVEDRLQLFLRTERFLKENEGFDTCEFLVLVAE